MHPEHPDPEAEILWMGQPGIKGIKLHGQMAQLKKRGIVVDGRFLSAVKFQGFASILRRRIKNEIGNILFP